MPETRRHKRLRVEQFAGPMAKTKVFEDRCGDMRTIIRCRECGWMNKSNRPGGCGATSGFALEEWSAHLAEAHAVFHEPFTPWVPDA